MKRYLIIPLICLFAGCSNDDTPFFCPHNDATINIINNTNGFIWIQDGNEIPSWPLFEESKTYVTIGPFEKKSIEVYTGETIYAKKLDGYDPEAIELDLYFNNIDGCEEYDWIIDF
jgi:hypothetical protein